MSGGTISEEKLNRWRPMYQEDVKKADLITLDIGYNDIWLPTSAASMILRPTEGMTGQWTRSSRS